MTSEPQETGTERCDLCETLEAETTEEVENDETGEVIEADLCGPCADKLRDYSRGEDVDFSDELRLPRDDDGLRTDGGPEQAGTDRETVQRIARETPVPNRVMWL